MKIVLTGGGSGGHITPILAVAHELKKQSPQCHITYIGQRGDDLLDVVRAHHAIDTVETVSAGKLRRYSSLGWRQLFILRIQARNVRDVFRTLRGLGQSFWLLRRIRPDVVFTRGGFVSVPVALAAALHRIPYITHDADSLPSLANKIIAPWARFHAVTLDAANYPYPPEKTAMVGIPVGHHFRPVTEADAARFKRELGIKEQAPVVLVTGGGNGAQTLNEAVVANARYLLGTYTDLVILHFSGRSLEAATNAAYDALGLGKSRDRVRVLGFAPDIYRYSGAADVVLARGGMSSIAELAVQQKACLLVPSVQLAWNVQNSHTLAATGAVMELSEEQAEQPERLGRVLGELLENTVKRQQLASNLSHLAKPRAAAELAALIIQIGTRE